MLKKVMKDSWIHAFVRIPPKNCFIISLPMSHPPHQFPFSGLGWKHNLLVMTPSAVNPPLLSRRQEIIQCERAAASMTHPGSPSDWCIVCMWKLSGRRLHRVDRTTWHSWTVLLQTTSAHSDWMPDLRNHSRRTALWLMNWTLHQIFLSGIGEQQNKAKSRS